MWKHGAYEGQTKEFTTIDDLIDDLMEKQARLSALLDRVMDVREAMMLVSLHSQNAARLGKLMLNKKALQKDAEDPFQQALNEVLDELEEELGLSRDSAAFWTVAPVRQLLPKTRSKKPFLEGSVEERVRQWPYLSLFVGH